MHFDLTDLRLFVNVVEAGTLTGGAATTCMTLASASERVRGLEAELGVPLLVRERQGVRPTDAGRTLLVHARSVLAEVDRLQAGLSNYGTGLAGEVRVLCNTSALAEHLPDRVAVFLRAHPGLAVALEERPSHEIVDALRNDLTDLGVVSDAADLANLETFPFVADPLVLVVARDDALAAKRSVRLADVADRAFVGLSAGSAFDEHLRLQARALGRHLRHRMRVANYESICRGVGGGVGVGIVPKAAAVRHARAAQVKAVPLADPWAMRRLVLCVKSRASLPVAASRLLDHLLASESP